MTRAPAVSWRSFSSPAALAMVALLVACGRDHPPASTPPSANALSLTGPARGCADVFLYRATADNRKIVTINVDVKARGMTPGSTRSFELVEEGPAVVTLEIYPADPGGMRHCEDSCTIDNRLPDRLPTARGTLELALLPGASTKAPGTYRATAHLRNVEFRAKNGSVVTLTQASFEDVKVGWDPG